MSETGYKRGDLYQPRGIATVTLNSGVGVNPGGQLAVQAVDSDNGIVVFKVIRNPGGDSGGIGSLKIPRIPGLLDLVS